MTRAKREGTAPRNSRVLCQITTYYFCAGLVFELKAGGSHKNILDWHCIEAAPILHYMEKKIWDVGRVMEYCKDKKWKFEKVAVFNK